MMVLSSAEVTRMAKMVAGGSFFCVQSYSYLDYGGGGWVSEQKRKIEMEPFDIVLESAYATRMPRR